MPFLRRPSYCLSFLTDEPWSFAMQIPYPATERPLPLWLLIRQSRAWRETRARGKPGHRGGRGVEAPRPGKPRGKVPQKPPAKAGGSHVTLVAGKGKRVRKERP